MKTYNFSSTLTRLIFSNFSENKNYRVKIRVKSYLNDHSKDEWISKGVVQAPSITVAKENALYKFSHYKVAEFKPSRALGGAAKGIASGALNSAGSSLVSTAIEGIFDKKKLGFKNRLGSTLKTTGISAAVGATMGGISGLTNAFSRSLNSSDIKVELVN